MKGQEDNSVAFLKIPTSLSLHRKFRSKTGTIFTFGRKRRTMVTKEFLDVDETGQLEAAATSLRNKLLIRIPRRLGIRISEVLGVRPEDIDFARGRLTILHLKTRMKLSCPQCGAKLGKKHKWCPG